MAVNGAHLHLLVNHLPVLGVPFGTGLLIAAFARRNHTLQLAGLVVLVLSGVAAETADLTGDPAKHVLRQTMGADYPRAQVEAHEDAADYGLASAGILAALSLVAIWFARRRALPQWLVAAFIVGGIFSTAVLMRVADLGGQIRHVEIR